MVLSDRVTQYAMLLQTRLKARRRESAVAGGVFVVAVIATLALGLLDRLDGRTAYLVSGVDIAFGVGYLHSWARMEIVRNTLELIGNLERG